MVKDHFIDGTLCLIEEMAIDHVEKVLKDYEPELIIEIGTYRGGFTKHLCKWFPGTPIYTFDLINAVSKRDAKIFRVDSKVSRVITSQTFENDVILPMLLASPVKKFLFCDGARKEEEINSFAGFLRDGDLLGVHDWNSEVNPENVSKALSKYQEHEVNSYFSQPGISELRFFIKQNIVVKNSVIPELAENDNTYNIKGWQEC